MIAVTTPDDTIEPPYAATIAPAHPYSDTEQPLAPTRSRRLTVGYLPASWPAYTPRPDPLPYLRLRGRWLEEAGFAVGAKIRVRIESRRLILEVESDVRWDPPPTPASVHEPRVLP